MHVGSIVSGQHPDDGHLRTTIRTRLADGSLPKIDGRAWAGNGSGLNVCVCCEKMIGRLDREFEARAATGLHAHGACYRVWLAESLGLRMYEPYADGGRSQETTSGA